MVVSSHERIPAILLVVVVQSDQLLLVISPDELVMGECRLKLDPIQNDREGMEQNNPKMVQVLK